MDKSSKKIPAGVTRVIDSYWVSGFVSGLIIFDGLAIVICSIDIARFRATGLSFMSAVTVAARAALDGRSITLGIAIMMFFVIALPMLAALLSGLVLPRERWSRYLWNHGKGVLRAHILLSGIIAFLTMTTVSMEVLSGWSRGETVSYSFTSIWLGAVSMGRPVYVFYISPIARKFLVRMSYDVHRPKIGEVIHEVITEERIGSDH